MEWVKSKVDYYSATPAIAAGSDALEVMFKRGDALAGALGLGGFIPDSMLHHLTRRPAQAKKLAKELVDAGLWERVKGGYMIIDWPELNAEAIKLEARKQRDRARKADDRRAARESASKDKSKDSPQDSPGESLYESESQSQSQNAAAASGAGETTAGDLPETVEILRSALEARKLVVRWDRLTSDEVAEIEQLVGVHGDAALVKSALAAYQPNKPVVYAKAWLGGWRQLRAPGDLRAVPDTPCPESGHSGTTRHCVQCASEALATPKENQ